MDLLLMVASCFRNNNTYFRPAFVEMDGHVRYPLTKNWSLLLTGILALIMIVLFIVQALPISRAASGHYFTVRDSIEMQRFGRTARHFHERGGELGLVKTAAGLAEPENAAGFGVGDLGDFHDEALEKENRIRLRPKRALPG